ncbi:hypothetical protein E3Q13_03651 [Wallemia mellicola]|nr:hypothetical protein E3Q13_03651 [Wallemia mellicola]
MLLDFLQLGFNWQLRWHKMADTYVSLAFHNKVICHFSVTLEALNITGHHWNCCSFGRNLESY